MGRIEIERGTGVWGFMAEWRKRKQLRIKGGIGERQEVFLCRIPMLQIILQKIHNFYNSKNRWWIPAACGLLVPLSQPPFNHETHWLFTLCPFLGFISFIPLLYFSSRPLLKRSLGHAYLFSYVAALGQFYWIGFDNAEGLWYLIIIGIFLASAVIALYYLVSGVIFRFLLKTFPRLYVLLFPAAWVIVDYLRTAGEMSFPWSLAGYTLTPLLPIAQAASLGGVWILSFLVILGNVLFMEAFRSAIVLEDGKQKWLHVAVFAFLLCIIAVWGWIRMGHKYTGDTARISCLQTNMDSFHWGNESLDTSFAITGIMALKAGVPTPEGPAGNVRKPDLLIMPESALLCYLDRKAALRERVFGWADAIRVPMIVGALHFDMAPKGSIYDYFVYNTAFFLDGRTHRMQPYFKIRLVPFSEAIPFEVNFPILSRINLGEADFSRGTEQTVFNANDRVFAAPFICYEIIYPGFVRSRIRSSTTNLLVNITNDAWFGKSSGPYQHAMMARMRSIETGISLARCANSGITMGVDPFGRIIDKTKLYERTTLTVDLPLETIHTLYARWGDWLVYVSSAFVMIAVFMNTAYRVREKSTHPRS